MSNLPRVAAAVAALLLLGTAAYHGTFYNEVSQSIANSSADAFLKRAVPAFWIFLSWHLAALALACVWAAVRGGPAQHAQLDVPGRKADPGALLDQRHQVIAGQ